MENIYGGLTTREEAKKRIFSWLYNPRSNSPRANQFYNRKGVQAKFWDGEKVKTPFGRSIPADQDHALNYLIQSACSDMVLRQAVKVHSLLKGRKSKLIFIVHDSIVIDYCSEDKQMLDNLVSCFSETELGKFRVGVQMGKDYGDMRSVKWTQS
jgi:DNA polymerase I-like protein with 3'-5' exonuclease and polymerase domains